MSSNAKSPKLTLCTLTNCIKDPCIMHSLALHFSYTKADHRITALNFCFPVPSQAWRGYSECLCYAKALGKKVYCHSRMGIVFTSTLRFFHFEQTFASLYIEQILSKYCTAFGQNKHVQAIWNVCSLLAKNLCEIIFQINFL